jgi:hypothetical protein
MRQLGLDGIPLIRLESDHLQVDVAPGVGGRVVSLIEKASGHEFLWRNAALPLRLLPAGSEYDPHFYGGIDELLPNDIPEVVDGIAYPDHGELWTLPLAWDHEGDRLRLTGRLPQSGLIYEREMQLCADAPGIELRYRLTNDTAAPHRFLWKLHAALAVAPGDVIECPARRARVVDLAWSRFHTLAPFDWPTIEGQPANVVPAPNGTVDFFYLFDLAEGRLEWRRPLPGPPARSGVSGERRCLLVQPGFGAHQSAATPNRRFMVPGHGREAKGTSREPRVGGAASPLAAVGAQRTARPTCGARFMAPEVSRNDGSSLRLVYRFDPQVFRYAWLFASYGGFNGHYTVILEPCTAMPLSVGEAAERGQCTRLGPGETLSTRVMIEVGGGREG